MPKKMNWRSMTRQQKSTALRRVLGYKCNRTASGRDIKRRYFRGVTHMGLITHCWRHGPKLPNARTAHPNETRVQKRRRTPHKRRRA